MDNTSPYQPLRPSSEGPHPLRPYYRPPSIGNPPSPNLPNATSSTGASLGAGAGNILSGFSYDDVVGDTSSWTGGIGIKALLDDAIWKYSSVFMAQPFEVAKVVLQVRLNEALDDKAAAQSTDSYSRASSSRHKDVRLHKTGRLCLRTSLISAAVSIRFLRLRQSIILHISSSFTVPAVPRETPAFSPFAYHVFHS